MQRNEKLNNYIRLINKKYQGYHVVSYQMIADLDHGICHNVLTGLIKTVTRKWDFSKVILIGRKEKGCYFRPEECCEKCRRGGKENMFFVWNGMVGIKTQWGISGQGFGNVAEERFRRLWNLH